MTTLAKRLASGEAPTGASPIDRATRAIVRIRAILARHPKLEPVALTLVRAVGAVEAAREIEWISERIA